MATVNFYIGLNDKDLHKQILDTETLKHKIISLMSNYYNSFSIALIDGVYKGEIEKTFKVSIMIDINYETEELDTTRISKCARILRDVFNQQCVMLEVIKDSIISFV